MENLDYFKYLSTMITNDERSREEIKCNIAIKQIQSKIRKSFQKQNELNSLEERSKLLHLQQVIFMVLKLAQFRKG
jgi:hypothetical protein